MPLSWTSATSVVPEAFEMEEEANAPVELSNLQLLGLAGGTKKRSDF